MVYPNFALPYSLDLDTVDSPRDLLTNLSGKIEEPSLVPALPKHDLSHSQNPLAAFPTKLTGDLCWDSTTFSDGTNKYVLQFSETDLDSIRRAISVFKGMRYCNDMAIELMESLDLGLPPSFLEPATFPLPEELGNRLRSVTSVLHDGIGFSVLRGLNPEQYCAEDNIIVYAGLLSYIGDQRVTNPLGMSIGSYTTRMWG